MEISNYTNENTVSKSKLWLPVDVTVSNKEKNEQIIKANKKVRKCKK